MSAALRLGASPTAAPLQSFTSYRTAEWGDLLADAMGIALSGFMARLCLGAARIKVTGAPVDRGTV